MSREISLPMSPPMVRAWVRGSKWQTRRLVSGEISERDGVPCLNGQPMVNCPAVLAQCRYHAGDTVWLREHWRTLAVHDSIPPRDLETGAPVLMIADLEARPAAVDSSAWGRFRPGMFMPRWASRGTDTIGRVRLERLQDISDADCFAEGIDQVSAEGLQSDGTARGTFRALWESLHGAGSWELNPWLWVLELERNRGSR